MQQYYDQRYRHMTIGEVLHTCATRFENRPFITMAGESIGLSYAEFERMTNSIAHGLLHLGKPNSGYCAIMLENSIEYVALTYALKKTDITEVSVNRAFRGDALARMINATKTEILITSPAHFPALVAIRDQLHTLETIITLGGDNSGGGELFEKDFPSLNILDFNILYSDKTSHIRAQKADTDLATIHFTSGTTGTSKGCRLSHRYGVRTAENVIPPFRVTREDCIYTPYPLSHIGPAYYDILPTMMTGGRVILRDGFSLSQFWPEVTRHKATWFLCLGSVQQLLWSQAESPLDKNHSMTRMWATPAPVDRQAFQHRFNLHLIPGGGYGSTDAGWVVAPQWDHAGGIILPEFDLIIADENDQPVSPNISGEILIRAKEPGIMSDGYHNMPERTQKSWRNGWFHTGDIGKLDDSGLFYFICRTAERIRVKGEMVSAFEVEEAALKDPALADCAAVGIASDLGEEEICLCVTLKPQEKRTEAQIIAHCKNHLAKFMVPAKILFMESLPRTPTGKVEKTKLLEIITQNNDDLKTQPVNP